MSVLIVGLSGVTNGGKSTLAQYLKKVLPISTKLIKQDDYFLPQDSPLHIPSPGGINHHNWDVISSLDMDTMVRDVKSVITKLSSDAPSMMASASFPSLSKVDFLKSFDKFNVKELLSALEGKKALRGIILIDGFTIYDDPRLREMIQLKFFLTLSKEECFSRRQGRVYDPPDPHGYFDACVWPMYENHLERVKKHKEVHFYHGSGNIETIFISVFSKIVTCATEL